MLTCIEKIKQKFMADEQFPQPNKPPTDGDFVPAPSQDSPSGMEYLAPEALGEQSTLPEATSFAELPNNAKIHLYRTDRFNRIAGQRIMPALQEYIDSPDSNISREDFDRDFSGELSPRGLLLDREGNETIHRPDSIARFRIDPIDENEAIESAYKQFSDEQKLGKTIDEAELTDDQQAEVLETEKAIELLSYADVLSEEEKAAAIEYTKTSPNGLKYVEELQALVQERGLERVMETAKRIKAECVVDLHSIGITPSKFGNSISWALWDIAKQSYYFKHPEERSEDYDADSHVIPTDMVAADPLGKGYNSERKRTEIVDRHIGWEADLALNESRFPEHVLKQDIAEDIAKNGERNETGQLKSFELARYGRRLRMLMGKTGPYQPPQS
jgi:hypothetical protein